MKKNRIKEVFQLVGYSALLTALFCSILITNQDTVFASKMNRTASSAPIVVDTTIHSIYDEDELDRDIYLDHNKVILNGVDYIDTVPDNAFYLWQNEKGGVMVCFSCHF